MPNYNHSPANAGQSGCVTINQTPVTVNAAINEEDLVKNVSNFPKDSNVKATAVENLKPKPFTKTRMSS